LGAIGGDCGIALFRLVVDRAAVTGMVRAGVRESDAVSVICALERWLAACAAQLPVLFRTEVRYSASGDDLDGGVCGLCSAMSMRGSGGDEESGVGSRWSGRNGSRESGLGGGRPSHCGKRPAGKRAHVVAEAALGFAAGVCFGDATGDDESYLCGYFCQPTV